MISRIFSFLREITHDLAGIARFAVIVLVTNAAMVLLPGVGLAQNRSLGAESLVLDDGFGNIITIQPPSGLTGSYTYFLPMPPGGSTTAGYVDIGSAIGQTLFWNGSAWVPSPFIANSGSNIGLGFTSVPASFAFPITLNATLGPQSDNVTNLGDATHRFNTIYVSNIVGPPGFTNFWQRTGTTLSPVTAGDNITTSGTFSGDGSGLTNLNASNLAAGTVPSGQLSGTYNINVSGNAATATTLSGTVAIANGGTGQTTQQSAIDALAGAQSSGKYLRSDGTHTTLTAIQAADVPTLNQSTTGNAATATNVTGTVAIANGGTGQTTQQSAIDALAGAQSSGKYLRSDGSHTTLTAIQAADVPTLNQSTTGNAATATNVTGTIAIANGGTGATSANTALNNLLPSQTGNDGKVLETNAGNTSWVAVGGTGTVTSIDVSGGTTGLTTSGGPVTTSGTITIAGAVNETHGGTNQTSYTKGDLLFASASNALGKLAIGSTNQVLTVQGGVPVWSSSGGGMTNPMTTTGDLIFASDNSGTPSRLAGQTTTAKKFLSQTGDGTNSAAPTWSALASGDIPNNAANISGTATNVTGIVAIVNGGTGQTTQQAAIDALAGSQSSGKYLRSDGTHTTLTAIQVADVPTLNQSTTGTASNVTGTVAIANGGTGQTTQQAAIDALAGAQSSGKHSEAMARTRHSPASKLPMYLH